MYKKLALAVICIIVLTALACKGKNTNNDDAISSEVQKEESETMETENNPDKSITDDTENNSDKSNTEEERKNTYHDVDIKVPSIHED